MDLPLRMRRENRGSSWLGRDPRCSSRVQTGMSGNFLSCLKGVRMLSGLRREGGISLEMLQQKRASARLEGRISLFFWSCGGLPLELRWGNQGPAHGASGRSSLPVSLEGPKGIPLLSLPGPRSSSGAEAGTSGLLSRANMDLGVPLGHPQGSQGVISGGAMQVRSPLEAEKHCQASCRVDHMDRLISLEVPQGCNTCHHILSLASG